MAIAPVNKFLSIAVPVAPGEQKLYEVPTGTTAILLYAQVSNVGIGQTYPTATLIHRRESRSTGNKRDIRIIKDIEIPPNVLVTSPAGPEGILAELSANVSAAGTISSVDVIASGRNFLPIQPIEVTFSGTGGAVGVAVTDPILFTVDDATEPTTAGLTTVTFNEFVPYSVAQGVGVEFLRISRIITRK